MPPATMHVTRSMDVIETRSGLKVRHISNARRSKRRQNSSDDHEDHGHDGVSNSNSDEDTDQEGFSHERDEVPRNHSANQHGPINDQASNLEPHMWDLIQAELYRGHNVDEYKSAVPRNDTDKSIFRFMDIPLELEKFIGVGFMLCFSSFLEFFTFLPLRMFFSFLPTLKNVITFQPLVFGHVYDMIRVALILICSMALMNIDISYVYHMIRGEVQSIVKLYVLFNVFDIIDKLMSSLGQDVLDSLYSHASRRSNIDARWTGIFISNFLLALIYVILHTLVNFMQFITLNVAINSANHALITILISNQFVELKGTVFKRFAQGNLFQTACADARERFHLMLLLTLVGFKNCSQIPYPSRYSYFVGNMLPSIGFVYGSEILVDWVKHGFVSRFNDIEPKIYRKFTRILFRDIAAGHSGVDYSHSIVRRLGLSPIPFACLVVVVVMPATSLASVDFWDSGFWIKFVLVFGTCLAIKMTLAVLILGKSCQESEEIADPHGEFKVRFPMEINKTNLPFTRTPLEDTYRFTMLSRVER
eukprot:m.75267 g.75267  ORF g.75267 m.75267 type:complete len:533 (-) comp24761_c1_seq1:132-1730(-)